MKYPESAIQRAFVQWCRLNEKRYPELCLAYAIPNGGKRSIITASILKGEGARSGVPDWHLPVPAPDHSAIGLWIEFKAGKCRPTPAQADYIALLRKYGHRVEICNDAEQAIEIVKTYLSPP